jgi:serine/threonine-protein kinase
LAAGNREAILQLIESRADIEGRFSSIRRLGTAGGDGKFSLVFTAADSGSKKVVALKVYNPERAGETYRVESFRREADLLGRLAGQPDIVRIVAPASQFTVTTATPQGFAFHQQLDYYAVELADGNALTAITNASWKPVELLGVFGTMCRAVQRIHAQKIAHRDLKPENFLVMRDGTVRLGDFGAAALVDGSAPRLLASYALWQLGDPRYAPPEIIASLHDEDPAIALTADVYALGAILFELFTGQVLGLQVFDVAFWNRLAQPMAVVARAKRQATFDQFVDQIVAAQPLPSMRAYGASVPPSIVDKLDRLYQAMSHLDYRKRLTDFSRVFNEVAACAIILRKEDAYRRWRLLRERRRKSNA